MRPQARRMRGLGLLGCALAASVVLACCSPGDGDGGPESTDAPAATEPVPAEGAGPTEGAGGVRLVDLDLDLDSPIAATAVPDTGSMIVAERGGRLYEVVLGDSGPEVVDAPLLDLTDRVGSTASELGFLGVAVSPDGAYLVASYTAAEDGGNRVERYQLSSDNGRLRVDEGSRVELLRIEQPASNHNGGHVIFGPDDMLYFGVGDGGGGGDPRGNAQNPRTLLGKILRLDAIAGPDQLIPDDNPFVGTEAHPEIWLTGVRNPWRFAFDPSTGDLWVADVGQNAYEEINQLPAADGAGRGANLGWDLYEGTEPFDDPDPAPGGWSDGPFVEPIHTYGRDRGCSITGGVVLRDPSLAQLDGAYLFADYCAPGVRALTTSEASETGDESSQVVDLEGTDLEQIVSFATTNEGQVWVISLSEGVHALERS